jgi:hypothetical protein
MYYNIYIIILLAYINIVMIAKFDSFNIMYVKVKLLFNED